MSTASSPPSSETLFKRSAPDADRIDDAKIFPNLISDLLNNGHRVKFRAPGYSMYPTILHEDVITVGPIKPEAIEIGDIILYRDQKNLIAHRVVKIEIKTDSQSSVLSTQSCFILRGDARPGCDDPVAAGQILGKVVLIETNGRGINPYNFKAKLTFIVRRVVFRLKRFIN
jgi:signal peptidase I